MMEETNFDRETGEMFPETISHQAIAASKRAVEAEEDALLAPPRLKLLSAMMAAVDALPAWITTDKKGAHNIKYATLKQILEKVRDPLHSNGLRIRQGIDRSYELTDGPGSKGRLVIVYTDIIHAESGEVERTIVEVPLMKMDAQAMGSAITYGRRYSLLAALGLATDEADDDGEDAKTRSLSDRVAKTVELLAMLKEIAAFKSATELAEWGQEPKQKKRLANLSEAEQAIAKQSYEDKAQALLNGDEEPTPAKGQKK